MAAAGTFANLSVVRVARYIKEVDAGEQTVPFSVPPALTLQRFNESRGDSLVAEIIRRRGFFGYKKR